MWYLIVATTTSVIIVFIGESQQTVHPDPEEHLYGPGDPWTLLQF